MWFECTFAFTMLEPWEKILCGESIWKLKPSGWFLNGSAFEAVVATTLFLLVGTGFVRYFPPHVKTMYERATYYWSGDASVLARRSGAML